MNNAMKYVITGHGSGVGKSIFDYYGKQPNVYCVGYDVSNNLDLSNSKVHAEFIEDCKDASVIVLNAPGEQHSSLTTLYNHYIQQSKHIILIGSMVSKIWKTLQEVPKGFENYWLQKVLLDKTVEELCHTNSALELHSPLKISVIRPAWIDTPLAKDYTGKKLTVDSVLNAVKFVIESKNIHITNMELQCTN